MTTYAEHLKKLVPLEAFEAQAFQPDDGYPQPLCDFVLSLALAFNDVRDLLITHEMLNAVWPEDDTTHTPELGEFNGLTQHMFRLELGTLHEILKLIEHNKSVLSHPSFVALVKKMGPKARNAWSALAAVALDAPAGGQGDLTRFLVFARNKVAFHYDRKEIARGFRGIFTASGGRQPYVSRGDTLAKSRFYFADAAAQEYMALKANEIGAPSSVIDALKLMSVLTLAINQVVVTFVSARGYAWRRPNAA